MRKILKISKVEFSILFYSPVAWLVLTIFFIQCGLGFLSGLQALHTEMSMGYDMDPLTNSLYAGNSGLFTSIQENLYLYIPILTMGLMSRETSSGSIKLLLSSPVKLREIILGKYLAIISYGFLMIMTLGFYTLIGVVAIKNIDLGQLVTGLLGLYLLICTYAAIGLFMSCITTYQVVAAISTLALLSALRWIGSVGQGIDFIRDLTYFLSISGRTGTFVAGLLTTRDVFYFIIIITSFLCMCVMFLQAQMESKPWRVKAGKYLLLAGCALMLGYFTSRPAMIGYLDLTATKSMTLTRAGQEVAKKIKGPLKITTYANLLDGYYSRAAPEARNWDLMGFEEFYRFLPGLDMEYVYYYDMPVDTNERAFFFKTKGLSPKQIAEKVATKEGVSMNGILTPAEIRRQIDLRPEGNLLVRKLEYNGRSSYLRFYRFEENPAAGEQEIIAAIKQLVVKVPKVLFISGNNERSIDKKGDRNYQLISNFKYSSHALINQGFDVDSLNLNTQNIPGGIDIVVLADPTIALSTTAQQKIAAYIATGGNLLIAGEPGRQALLNQVLQPLGVQLKTGTLVTPDKDLTPGFVPAEIAKKGDDIDTLMRQFRAAKATIAIQGAAAIDVVTSGNFTVNPLLLSYKTGWNKAGAVDLNSTDFTYNPVQGDQKGVFPIAVSLTRNIGPKQQRIIVTGDADFMSNRLILKKGNGNDYYTYGLFRWLSYGAFPVNTQRPQLTDTSILLSREEISALMYLCRGIIPAIIAVMGAIVLFRRRSK